MSKPGGWQGISVFTLCAPIALLAAGSLVAEQVLLGATDRDEVKGVRIRSENL
jgi:hypothetical protein